MISKMQMISRIIILSAMLLLMVVSPSRSQDSRGIDFNSGWKFYKGDGVGFEKRSFNDAAWRMQDLPHDWSIEGPFSDAWASGTGYLPGGIGWYRKSFTTTKDLIDKVVYLYFDGVYKNSEVWINEHYLGKRPNGYASFYHDITKYLDKKGKNVVAVRVDHTDFADSRWYSGSGINRKVYLINTNPIHVNVWGIAFVTPIVSKDRAHAEVSLEINNQSTTKSPAIVKTELLWNDVVVASKEKEISWNGNTTKETLAFEVSNPQLWSIETPHLYKLRVSIVINKKVVDVVTEQVGFRSFTFEKDTGFSLNGKSIKLKGVCIHDDAGALGSAVPAAVWERRLKILKTAGVNAIRMSHNPHQDYLYDLCDRLGFLVQDEAFDEWELGKNKWIKGWNVGTPGKDGYNKDFSQWAERDLTDMILRNRNRACVIMWSIGNEIDYPNDPYTHEVLNTGRNPQIYGKGYQVGNPPAKQLGVIAKRLVAAAKRVDNTRPITAALAGVVMSNETTYPDELDVVGYNYQEYRYADDHNKYPNRIIYGSENGQSNEAWRAVADNDFISAQFLWAGFDFLGEARAWPIRSSGAGMLDLAGYTKSQFHFRKSVWRDEPSISMLTSKIEKGRGFHEQCECWDHAAGDSIAITVFTNLEEAELFVNGKSLGVKRRESGSTRLSWRSVFSHGEIVVKGLRDGKEFSSKKLQSAATASKIVAVSDRAVVAAHRDSVAHIDVSVTDDNGVAVFRGDQEMEIVVTGPGKLIGLESGDLSSHEDYKSTKRRLYHGRLLAYIQASAKGQIRIEVRSPGLTTASLVLKAE
ncbi:glycoside hydrolase family 2 TIM barrel-domain containing protein [Pseudochryseolinea flava]|uniref:Beta-galactosidase n=1 Tax=Pseudochryseolinea flava TaxID=2059302 RepID=A0A364Y5T7_9BACT|nr:glycoside hydrolase family 2 TIM barrel-domain containing protein [Pseudochryseolinea flava]RAW02323.1 beta-galactosidase [Pseudochryseolinea flava]